MTAFTLFGLALAPLYAAIAEVESNNGDTDPNVYQIETDGHGYIGDVNRILAWRNRAVHASRQPRLFTASDALNRSQAEYMMAVYWSYYGERYQRATGKRVTYEVLARIHNGGPNGWKKRSTCKYWAKVRAAMERQAAK